jgi:hypothetical protein
VFAARTEEDRALVLAAQSDTAAAGQLFDKYLPGDFFGMSITAPSTMRLRRISPRMFSFPPSAT